MSILQEYEEIKKYMGSEKWNHIDDYIKNNNLDLRLDQIIYNKENFINYNNWYYENIESIKAEIKEMWETDYDDIRCYAILYKDNNEVGRIIASYENENAEEKEGFGNNFFEDDKIKSEFKSLIYDDFDKYLKLPKISECSKLLVSIYESVCESDATMCHITEEDWENLYKDLYTEQDIEVLKEEVKKYGLENIIIFDNYEYKIVGYGDLETRFNDNRFIGKDNESDNGLYI